ncbi:hypothetical protein RCZ04_16110 [Capnocytophaga sp. HP1101]
MTGSELQETLNKLCSDIKANLSGLLFCGVLNCADATYVIGVSNLGKFFLLLGLDRAKANLAIARGLIEKSRPLAMKLDEQF